MVTQVLCFNPLIFLCSFTVTSDHSRWMMLVRFDRFGFRAGDGLDNAQNGFGIGGIGQIFFAICCNQFQSVTICHRLTPFFFESFFQLIPILTSGLVFGLMDQDLDNVNNGEIPFFGILIVMPTYFLSFKDSQRFFHLLLLFI